MKRWMAGPAAWASLLLALGFWALAVVAMNWRIHGTEALVAPAAVFALAGLLVIVLGARTVVRLGDVGVEVVGDPVVPWADIAGVRVDRRGRFSLPVLEVVDGRAVRDVDLDGLMSWAGSSHVVDQAQRLATYAHVDLDLPADDAPAASAAPRRSA